MKKPSIHITFRLEFDDRAEKRGQVFTTKKIWKNRRVDSQYAF